SPMKKDVLAFFDPDHVKPCGPAGLCCTTPSHVAPCAGLGKSTFFRTSLLPFPPVSVTLSFVVARTFFDFSKKGSRCESRMRKPGNRQCAEKGFGQSETCRTHL